MLVHWVWRWPVPVLVLIAIVIGGMEVVFLAANLTKIASGGWVPLLIAAAVLFVMTTWRRGYAETTQLRIDREGSVADFIRAVNDNPVRRTPGVAVFPHHDSPTVPLALRANVEFNRVLHKQVVIVSLADVNIPHVPDSERVTVENLGDGQHGGFVHVICRIGFNDSQNVPNALALAGVANPELSLDPEKAHYYLSF